MRRHRHVMNAMRSQIRKLEGNPGLPGGVLAETYAKNPYQCTEYGSNNLCSKWTWFPPPPRRSSAGVGGFASNPGLPGGVVQPSVAWLEANCAIAEHDYGNGNVQYVYTCDHWGSGGRKYRCRWTRWSNSNAIGLLDCNEITRPHYHEVHGGSEGPQSYGVAPPWQPYGTYHYGRWTTTQPSAQPYLDESLSFNYGRVRTNPDPQTPVCPPGQEPCGNTTNGGVLCCDIPIKGPTPAGGSRRPKLGFRDRIKLSYRLLFR